jgi:hypothetical protein
MVSKTTEGLISQKYEDTRNCVTKLSNAFAERNYIELKDDIPSLKAKGRCSHRPSFPSYEKLSIPAVVILEGITAAEI